MGLYKANGPILFIYLLLSNYLSFFPPNIQFFSQLVYKVKLDFVLEQLASASVGGYGQDVWSDLVDEAKTNLMKITVSVKPFLHMNSEQCPENLVQTGVWNSQV